MAVLRQTTGTLAARALGALALVLSLAAPALLSLAAPAHAATVRIDFDDRDGTPASGWNLLDAGDSGALVDLTNASGGDSGIDLLMPSVLDGGFDGWNDATPLPSWLPLAAADDYVYANGTIVFGFSGLDPTLTYDLTLVVSRDLSRSQDHRLFTGAGNVDVFDWNSQSDGYVPGNVILFAGVASRADGTLDLGIRPDGASLAVNAVQIQSVAEPATLALALSAGLWVVLRRRR